MSRPWFEVPQTRNPGMDLLRISNLSERFRNSSPVHLATKNRIPPKTTEKEVLKVADTAEIRGREATLRTDIAGLDQGVEVVQGEETHETSEVVGLPKEAEIATLQTEDLVTCTETVRSTDLEETIQDQIEPLLKAKDPTNVEIDLRVGLRIESDLTETIDPLASDLPRNTVRVRKKRKMPLHAAKTPIPSSLNLRRKCAIATNANLN